MINGHVSGGGVKNAREKLISVEAKLQEYHMQYVIMLRSVAEANVKAAIGEKAKHFKFVISGSGESMQVKMVFVDDVGKYLYYGTKPHKISVSGEKAMPMGGGVFTKEVNHPGTKPLKPIIDDAIARANTQTKAALGSFRRRI